MIWNKIKLPRLQFYVYFFLKLGKHLILPLNPTLGFFCLGASWSPLHLSQRFPGFVSNGLWVRASLFFSFSIWNSPKQVFIIEIRRGSINPFYNEGEQSQDMKIDSLTCDRRGGQPAMGAGKGESLPCKVSQPHQCRCPNRAKVQESATK